MRELDTIADFAKYLADVESFLKHDKQVLIMEGGHQDLLALYLTNNRSFPFVADKLIIEGGLWQKIENRPEFIRRKQEDKVSYLWDRIIEEFSLCLQSGILEVQSEPSETENVLRVMASEDRFSRRLLANELLEMQLTTPKTHRRAKIVPALSGVTYVFLICEKDLDRDSRRHELGARCFVARGKFPSSPVVVGIATEHMNPEGHSFDAFYLRIDKWREENQRAFERTQEEFGFFDHARMIHVTDHEYPTDDRSTVGDARQSK